MRATQKVSGEASSELPEMAAMEQIWRFAFEFLNRFGVNGPLVPYYSCE